MAGAVLYRWPMAIKAAASCASAEAATRTSTAIRAFRLARRLFTNTLTSFVMRVLPGQAPAHQKKGRTTHRIAAADHTLAAFLARHDFFRPAAVESTHLAHLTHLTRPMHTMHTTQNRGPVVQQAPLYNYPKLHASPFPNPIQAGPVLAANRDPNKDHHPESPPYPRASHRRPRGARSNRAVNTSHVTAPATRAGHDGYPGAATQPATGTTAATTTRIAKIAGQPHRTRSHARRHQAPV